MTGALSAARAFAALVAFLVASWPVLTLAQPAITRPVTDEAGVLSDAEERAIAERLVRHRQQTGVQMAVLTVGSTFPDPIEDYALRAAERWGGGSEGRDDGILLVFAVKDRRSRLEVGYGLEPNIPDPSAKSMLDRVRPELKEGRYGDAVRAIVDGVVDRTREVRPDTRLPKRKPTAFRLPLEANYPFAWFVGVAAGIVYLGLRRHFAGPTWEAVVEEREPAPDVHRTHRRVLVGVVFGVVPLVSSLALFGAGKLAFLAYALVSAAGALAVAASPELRNRSPVFAVAAVLSIALFPLFLGHFDSHEPQGALFCLLVHLAVALASVLVLFIFGGILIAGASGGGTSYGASGSSSWPSSSSSSSSWSSSSSSSSSSSASSGWSGGGGAFGGGGASSSW